MTASRLTVSFWKRIRRVQRRLAHAQSPFRYRSSSQRKCVFRLRSFHLSIRLSMDLTFVWTIPRFFPYKVVSNPPPPIHPPTSLCKPTTKRKARKERRERSSLPVRFSHPSFFCTPPSVWEGLTDSLFDWANLDLHMAGLGVDLSKDRIKEAIADKGKK